MSKNNSVIVVSVEHKRAALFVNGELVQDCGIDGRGQPDVARSIIGCGESLSNVLGCRLQHFDMREAEWVALRENNPDFSWDDALAKMASE